MTTLLEVSAMADRAARAIEALQPSRRGGPDRGETKKFVRSIYGVIKEARLRGVTMKAIVETLRDDVKMKISYSTLSKKLREIEREDDAAAERMAGIIAGRGRRKYEKAGAREDEG